VSRRIDETGNELDRRFQIGHLLRGMSTQSVAEKLNVTDRTIQRWIQTGLTWQQADEFACKILAENPASVWGLEWEVAADENIDLSPTLFGSW